MAYKNKEQRQEYDRQYHAKRTPESKAHKVLLQNQRRRKAVLEIRAYKESIGCADCGIKDFRVLDFDHKDTTTKLYNIADMLKNGYSIKNIMLEIAKCEVRCSNCHRIRTASQFSW